MLDLGLGPSHRHWHEDIDVTDHEVTSAIAPPLTVDYARLHLRSLTHQDDQLIETWIRAAGQIFEERTGRQINTATREMWLDRFPWPYPWPGFGWAWGHALDHRRLELPKPPLQTVLSVTYVDSNGDTQSFSSGGSPDTPYWQTTAPAGTYARPGTIEPICGQSWPCARHQTAAVKIRYTCGYGDSSDAVPDVLKSLLCFLVGEFDQERVAVRDATRGVALELPFGVSELMQAFKMTALPTRGSAR